MQTRNYVGVCLTLITALSSDSAIPQASQGTVSADVVVILVHGRGQDLNKAEQLRASAFATLASGLKAQYGDTVVPAANLKFVWYADAVDPNRDALPTAADCQFFSIRELGYQLSIAIRDGLVVVARTARLDKFGMKVLTTDTYNYLSHPAVRCDADARVYAELKAAHEKHQKVVLVAHSMGGIVSFSTLSRLSSVPNSTLPVEFITVGTQVGLKEVQQGLSGSFVELPVPVPLAIQKWANFQNAGDVLAFDTKGSFESTDASRLPLDIGISQTGERHALVTYLSNKEVLTAIASAWCRSNSSPPSICGKVLKTVSAATTDKGSQRYADIDGLIDRLSVFFRIPKPTFDLQGAETKVVDDRHITVDRRQLEAYENAIGVEYSSEIALFVLAHESAHIARLRQLPSWKPNPRENECNADLWAGAAFINHVLGMASPAETSARLLRVVELATESGRFVAAGRTESAGGSYQPRQEQRAMCVARGMSAGLQLWRLTRYKRSERSADRQEIERIQQEDPDMFGVDADVWEWSARTAAEIVSESPAQLDRGGFNVELVLALASSAERGTSELRKRAQNLAVRPPVECVLQPDGVTCKSPGMVLDAIAYVSFDSWRGMLRPALLSRGWTDLTQSARTGELFEEYAKGSARTSVRVNGQNRDLTISVLAQR